MKKKTQHQPIAPPPDEVSDVNLFTHWLTFSAGLCGPSQI